MKDKPVVTSPAAKLGRRELNKQEYLERIKSAAEAVFIEKGFDDASIREIAARADVGVGTVFNYAQHKRDLLFLVVNEPLVEATNRAFADVPSELPIVEQIIVVFRYYYWFFGEHPELGRFMLQESSFYDSGPQGERFQQQRGLISRKMTELIERAQQNGKISSDEDPELVGELALSILGRQVRLWLRADEPEVESGLIPIRRLLVLAMRSVGATG